MLMSCTQGTEVHSKYTTRHSRYTIRYKVVMKHIKLNSYKTIIGSK